jgi:hypothetical protein
MLPTQVLANLNLTAYGLCRLGYWVPQMVGNRINAKSYCMAHILMLSVAGNSYPWRKLGYQIIANQNTINSINHTRLSLLSSAKPHSFPALKHFSSRRSAKRQQPWH